MKQLIALLTCVLTTSVAFAGGPAGFFANISGTIYQQTGSGDDAKVVTSPLNAKRIFDEFGVSSADYVLLLSPSESLVNLVPKISGGLPVIPVLAIADAARTVNNKTTGGFVEAALNSPSASDDNIFKGFRGTLFGAIKFSPATEQLQRFSFNVTGSSGILLKADEAKAAEPKGAVGEVSPITLFKFKVSKGAPFNQTPGPL